MSPLLRKLLMLLALALLCVGCGDPETREVDPDVDYGSDGMYVPMGDPTVDVGFYKEQLYVPLLVGDSCPIVWGLQGGTWTMPAIRTQGIDTIAMVDCTVETSLGEQVGVVQADTQFFLATDGWLETQSFPVPIEHEGASIGDDISDLYGQEATLSCTVTDSEGRTSSDAIQVVLTEG